MQRLCPWLRLRLLRWMGYRWYRQGHFAQLFSRQSQVDECTVAVAVTEQIPNGFERGAGAQQVDGVRVAQAVCPIERDGHAAPFGPSPEDPGDGGAAQGSDRVVTAQKKGAVRDIVRSSVS